MIRRAGTLIRKYTVHGRYAPGLQKVLPVQIHELNHLRALILDGKLILVLENWVKDLPFSLARASTCGKQGKQKTVSEEAMVPTVLTAVKQGENRHTSLSRRRH